MFLHVRNDGASFTSCSSAHAIELAGFLSGLDPAYRYRAKRIAYRGGEATVCFHCGMCGINCFPDVEVCSLHLIDGLSCPTYDWTATAAYVFGATAATTYFPSADLDEIEELVEYGAWTAPDALVYALTERYRPAS